MRDDIQQKRCPKCGYYNEERYCRDCGHDLQSNDDIERLAQEIAKRLNRNDSY